MSWLKQLLKPDVSPEDLLQAQAAARANTNCIAFNITPENVSEHIRDRAHLFRSIYPAFNQLCDRLSLEPKDVLETLWHLWLPSGMQIASCRQQLGRPLIQGILGGQGTGKTTMCAILSLILENLGYRTLSLSIDDLYKTYQQRLALQQLDPRLLWRGPPGTHDVELGLSVLDKIRRGERVSVPRFDKSLHGGQGDRTTPETVQNIDIVLFEGWFVGVQPINDAAFATPPLPIVTREDKAFASDMNRQLDNYLPLWSRLDRLILLYPEDYRLSLEWRKQAEHQAIAAGKAGMSDSQLESFVNYFWRSLHPELFISPMVTSPEVDLVIGIKGDRSSTAKQN